MPFRFLIPNFFNMIKIEKYENIIAMMISINTNININIESIKKHIDFLDMQLHKLQESIKSIESIELKKKVNLPSEEKAQNYFPESPVPVPAVLEVESPAVFDESAVKPGVPQKDHVIDLPKNNLKTVREVANWFGVSPNSVQTWLRSGKLKGYRLGTSMQPAWRIEFSEALKFLKNSRRLNRMIEKSSFYD